MSQPGHSRRSSSIVRTSIILFGVGWLLALRTTAPDYTRGDPADSPLFFVSYLLLPLLAFVGAAMGMERSGLAWSAIALPGALWILGNGLGLLHSFDDNAFWILGMGSFLLMALFAAAGGWLGAAVNMWLRRTSAVGRTLRPLGTPDELGPDGKMRGNA